MVKLKEIIALRKNELFMGSFILLILLNAANFLNYLFHLVMARMLGPIDYGVLAVLTSIIYIFSVPSLSIQTLISKKVTEFNIRGDVAKLKGFFINSEKKLIKLSLLLFFIFIGASFYLKELLGISEGLILVTGFVIFGSLLSPLALGALQGMKKFSVFGYNQVAGSLLKLIIAVVLVLFGLKVYGPIIGFVIGILSSFFIALPYLKEILKSENIENIEVKLFSQENLPTLISILSIVLMYSIDIILAKIFFSPELAGKYAVASMFGKMIFIGTMAVGNALFPISSERFLKKNGTTRMFKRTIIVISTICAFVILLYYLIPGFLVNILFGTEYTEISGILVYIGVTFSIISILNLIVLYRISKDKFDLTNATSLVFYLIIQMGLMSVYRQNLIMFTTSFMVAVTISFLGNLLLLYARK